MAVVRQVLRRLSCSNETVRNAPKHEFWLQWSRSGAFVAKNLDTTLFSQFCIDFRAVTKLSEMPENMSFGSYGVDRKSSLQKKFSHDFV
jgi:hypothetical protein